MNLNDIYSEIITEHSQSNANKRTIENPDIILDGVNPSCGDELKIAAKMKDGKIEDLAFTGSGCAISQASASLMSEELKGMTVAQARDTIALFISMIQREPHTDEELEALGDAVALKNISNLPARVKCAVLAWHTLSKALADA